MPFTYSDVGGTANDLPRPEFHTFSKTIQLPAGLTLDAAASDLFRWQVQVRAGLRVCASTERVEVDSVAIMYLGPGRLSMRTPLRVVYVVDEPGRRGFAYGTLPGHPESGEESFILEQHSAGDLTFTVSAFSRHGTWFTRVAGPVARRVQHLITDRYLRAFTG